MVDRFQLAVDDESSMPYAVVGRPLEAFNKFSEGVNRE